MVASESPSNLSSSSSLDLSRKSLDISSAEEKLQVSDLEEPTSSYECSAAAEEKSQVSDLEEPTSSSEDEEDAHVVRKSPFYVYYMRDDGWPSSASTQRLVCEAAPLELGDANCGSDSSRVSPASPCNTSPHGVSWTKRETLLAEAWERKRKLMLQEELSNLEDRAQPGRLGRSASCVKPMSNLLKLEQLNRSVSSCGKSNTRVWRTHTRSLTDDDFEELQGCIDLGFRFDQSSISDLCDTFPALEVCAAVAQNFQGSSCSTSPASSPAQSFTPSPTFSWTIASPGDDDEEIKERLRHWAQAVVFNTKLCY